MADRGPDAAQLVGGHRGADTRAADEDAAVGVAGLDRVSKSLREVRVVVSPGRTRRRRGRSSRGRARLRQAGDQRVLEGGSGMIGGEGDCASPPRIRPVTCSLAGGQLRSVLPRRAAVLGVGVVDRRAERRGRRSAPRPRSGSTRWALTDRSGHDVAGVAIGSACLLVGLQRLSSGSGEAGSAVWSQVARSMFRDVAAASQTDLVRVCTSASGVDADVRDAGPTGASVWPASPCGGCRSGRRRPSRIRPRRPSRTTRAADVGDAIGGEPEVLEDRPGRRRRAEVIEPDDRALVADPALPAERHADLDADALAHGRRQDRVAVGLILGVEPLPARQRHDPRRDAVGLEGLGGGVGQLQLGAGADQDELRASPPVASRRT